MEAKINAILTRAYDLFDHVMLVVSHAGDIEGHWEPYLRLIDESQRSTNGMPLEHTSQLELINTLYGDGEKHHAHACGGDKACTYDDIRDFIQASDATAKAATDKIAAVKAAAGKTGEVEESLLPPQSS